MKPTINSRTGPHDDSAAVGRTELQRAYLHAGFGQYEQALAACDRANRRRPDHYLPATLKGGFEIAFGRLRQALQTLQRAKTTHPDQPLPLIYFAEACFLAGRPRQAFGALEQVETMDLSSAHDELVVQLRQFWEEMEFDRMPAPIRANVDRNDE